MTRPSALHEQLLVEVADKLSQIPSATDHLMLTRWRLVSAAQYLLGAPEAELETACIAALRAFQDHGPGVSTDKALAAIATIIERIDGSAPPVLPLISQQKRRAVFERLHSLAKGPAVIPTALGLLPLARQQMSLRLEALSFLPGLKHRFDQVAAVLENPAAPESHHIMAAAGVLYIHQHDDVIPDGTRLIGMMDDDYALRLVLEGFVNEGKRGAELHWSEKVCSLWYDMPFLQGMNLRRAGSAIPVSWLDRLNSYVACTHVLRPAEPLLILLQPSISSSPLHPITSLVGLIILDALTSSRNQALTLRAGQTYEIDGAYWVRFEGLADQPAPGWLRLRVRDGCVYQPPALASRMVPVRERKLSTGGEFTSRARTGGADYIQRFFNWGTPIGPALVSSHLVWVSSQQRVLDLLDGVQSNGVRLLDHSLVRFIEAVPTELETYGTLIFVVPSLSTARALVDRGLAVQAILVDGYHQLQRGRHDLPFFAAAKNPPQIICWSAAGYFPADPPSWLPEYVCVQPSRGDLVAISEQDHYGSVATSSVPNTHLMPSLDIHVSEEPAHEGEIVRAIDDYLEAVRSSGDLPEYWQYHLRDMARTLRLLVTSTPALWPDIRGFARLWTSAIDEKWASLRSSTIAGLASVRDAERQVLALIDQQPDGPNSRAVALLEMARHDCLPPELSYFVSDDSEQAKAIASFLRSHPLHHVQAMFLRQLPVLQNCIVAGWVSSSFARRMYAHAPKSILAIVNDRDHLRWSRAASTDSSLPQQSILAFTDGTTTKSPARGARPVSHSHPTKANPTAADPGWQEDQLTTCAFLWLTGEDQVKIVPRDARMIVHHGDLVRERIATRLKRGDRVLLGSGSGRWSPADEFTEALVEAVEASNPELVKVAKEWRTALSAFRDAHGLPTGQLRTRLAEIGVAREAQTLDGWLQLDRASPIAPRGRTELAAIWPLIGPFARNSLEEVSTSCKRLRALRISTSRALLQAWKGKGTNLGIDDGWIEGLLDRLRREVQVYDIEDVSLGEVPPNMLGWWLPTELVTQFELSSDGSGRPSPAHTSPQLPEDAIPQESDPIAP